MKRFKSRPQFQAALNAPVIAKSQHFVMHRLLIVPEPVQPAAALFTQDVWLGAMVPKRWAKRAVTRNTLKRQIYSVGSASAHQFSRAVYLIRLRSEFSRQSFPSASSDALQHSARTELTDLLQVGLNAK